MSNYNTLKRSGYIGKIAHVFFGYIVKFDKIFKNDLNQWKDQDGQNLAINF